MGKGSEDAAPKPGPTEDASGPRTRSPSLDSFEVVVDPTSIPPVSNPPSIPPIATVGRWELLGRLAVGGMAEIYLANERMSAGGKRRVVIKLVRPAFAADDEFEKMFVAEGKVVMQLSHPQICHVYEFGKIDDRYFIAMEYVQGATLLQFCKRFRELKAKTPVATLVRIAADIAGALHVVHRLKDRRGKKLGIVHRDVSPQNIMVSYEGSVKLLDFGVATTKQDLEEAGSNSTIKGKFAYMSPEQCSGKPVDGRSDVFSLGICLHEALTGKQLFKRHAQFETLRAVVETPAPSIRDTDPSLSGTLDEILRKALAKDPAHRYQTAGELQEALERYLLDTRAVVVASQTEGLMEAFFGPEIEAGPQLDRSEEAQRRVSELHSLEVMPLDLGELTPIADPTGVQRIEKAPLPTPALSGALGSAKKLPIVPLAIGGGVLLLVLIAVLWAALSGGSPPPVAHTPVVTPPPTVIVTTLPVVAPTTTPAITAPPTPPAVVLAPPPTHPPTVTSPPGEGDEPTKVRHHHHGHFVTDPGF